MFNLSVISNEFIYVDCVDASQEIIFNDGVALVYNRHHDWWDAEYHFALYKNGECIVHYGVEGAVNTITTAYAIRSAKAAFGEHAKYIEVAHI